MQKFEGRYFAKAIPAQQQSSQIGARDNKNYEELVQWLKTLRCDMYAGKMREKGITSLLALKRMSNEELKKRLNEVFRGCDLSDKRRLMIALEKTKNTTSTTTDDTTELSPPKTDLAHSEEIKQCEEELMQTIEDKFEQKERILDDQLRQIAEIELQIKRTMENAQRLCNCGCAGDAERVLVESLKSTQETMAAMKNAMKFVDMDIASPDNEIWY